MTVCRHIGMPHSCHVKQSWTVACFQGYVRITDAEDTQNANMMQTCPESRIFPSFCFLGNPFGYRNRFYVI